MDETLRDLIGRVLKSRVVWSESVRGGDVNQGMHIRLADGKQVFIKTRENPPPRMYETEARGLTWLGETRTLRVPNVIAVFESAGDEPSFLALEYVDGAPKRKGFEDLLGQGLAALHQFGSAEFGLDYDNFVGPLPQDNTIATDWAQFYRERRLEPQIRRAVNRGHFSSSTVRDFDRVFQRLPEIVGPSERPARLHGDLWSGNVHTDEAGNPCLIDPAVYGGHREIDLAMMKLFGGFGPRFFSSYDEAFPLSEGYRERVSLYQLYPLLVHVNLFGSSYVGQVLEFFEA